MQRLLSAGIFFFNAGRYFEAHEVWEDLWRAESEPRRDCYQGLIQAAVGMHHLSRNNKDGARAQLAKSLVRLDRHGPESAGIDLERLRCDLRKVLAQIDVEAIPEVRIVRLKSADDVVQSDVRFED